MIADNLRLLLALYLRPRAALAGIVDVGSLLFAALLTLAVSVMLQVVSTNLMRHALTAAPPGAAREAAPAPPAAVDRVAPPDESEPDGTRAGAALGQLSFSVFGVFSTMAGLAVLYVPATLLLVTAFDRIGSFGVVLRRDYGPLLACTFMAWSAAFLPTCVVGLALPAYPGLVALLVAISLVAFLVLVAVALQVVSGASSGAAAGAVAVSWLSFLLQGFLVLLLSPFLLWIAYHAVRGDLGEALGSWGTRQSFRRHLQAATVNPRDAEAHYQLGLIHLQRRQPAEAAERFRRAVEIDPGEIDAHFQLARIARAEGRLEEALAHLEQVLRRDPRHAQHEAWREAGAVYVAHEDWTSARSVLEKFVEARPWDPEGLYQLGLAERRLGNPETARELLGRCVEAARTAPDHRRRELRGWQQKAERELHELDAPPA